MMLKIILLCFLGFFFNNVFFCEIKEDLGIDIGGILDAKGINLNLDKYILKILSKDKKNIGGSTLKKFIDTDASGVLITKDKNLTSNNPELNTKKSSSNDAGSSIKQIKQSDIVYLDYQGSTPCFDIEVRKLFLDVLRYPGNANAIGKRGEFLYKCYDHARKLLASLINSEKEEVFFTSGATESNNIAILGYVRSLSKDSHIITTSIEHASVLNTFKALKKEGYDVTIIKVDKDGMVDIDLLEKTIKEKTKFISIMYVNNEIGTIQNIKKIGELCKGKGIVFHTDAAQAFGKIKIDVKDLNIDMMSASAQKVYAIPGCGLLYISKKLQKSIKPIMYGGEQQGAIRPGTIPVALVIAFAKAAEITYKNLNQTNEKVKKLQLKLHNAILSINSQESLVDGKPLIELNGSYENRVLGNLNYSIRGVDPDDIIKHIGDEFSVSFGSACESNKSSSHVIVAIDKDLEKSPTNLRIGFGRFISESSIDRFIEKLRSTIKYLRKTYPNKGQRTCEVGDVSI